MVQAQAALQGIYKRNRRKRKPRMSYSRARKLSRMAVGVPQKIIRKLRYQSNKSLTISAAGATNVNVYRINSLFDPDFTGTGDQPRYFDQYMALYDRYLVLGARVKCTFYNTSSSEQNRCGMVVKTKSADETIGKDYIENERLQRNTLVGVEGGGGNIKTLILNWSGKKWFGKPRMTTEYDLTGSATTNPSTAAYLHVFSDNPWGYQNGGVRYTLTIDYIVQFKEPLMVTGS